MFWGYRAEHVQNGSLEWVFYNKTLCSFYGKSEDRGLVICTPGNIRNGLLPLAEELFLLACDSLCLSKGLWHKSMFSTALRVVKGTMISETQTQETYHNTRPGKRIISKDVQLYSTRSRLSSRRAWELGLVSWFFSGLAGLSDSQESGWVLAPDKTRIFWNPQDNVRISLC